MKNLLSDDVKKLFEFHGCRLLEEYNKCDLAMSYICSCGKSGFISLDKFKRRIKNNSGCKSCNSRIWSEDEDNFIRLSYGKLPRQELLNVLQDVSYNELKNRAYKLGLQGNRSFVQSKARKGKGRKYEIDFNFFDKVDVIRSYWAGFIAMNGNIGEDKGQLSISVNENHLEHLELFKDSVGYKGDSKLSVNFYGVEKWLIQLKNSYNLVPKKMLTPDPPVDLNEINSLSFIIGYIDGFDCIHFKNGNALISMVGSNNMMCWIKTWFDIWSPSIQRRYAVVRLEKGKKGYYKYCLSGQRAMYLLRKMKKLNVPNLSIKKQQVE